MDCSPPGFSVHEDSPGKNTGVDCYALLQGNLPNPGIEPRSPTLQVDSLPAEPQYSSTFILIMEALRGFPEGLCVTDTVTQKSLFSHCAEANQFSLDY